MSRTILVVLSEYGYWGEELLGPVTAFDEQGYTTVFATPTGKRAQALPPRPDPRFRRPAVGSHRHHPRGGGGGTEPGRLRPPRPAGQPGGLDPRAAVSQRAGPAAPDRGLLPRSG